MQHLDEGTVHAWLDGALAADEAAAVASHVEACRDCAAMVAEARGMIAATGRIVSALDDVPAGVIPTPRRSPAGRHSLWRRLRLTPARAALAATVLLTVGTLFASRQSAKDVVPASRSVATSAVPSSDSAVKSERRDVAATTAAAAPAPEVAPAPPVTRTRREGAPVADRNSEKVSRTKVVAGAATANAGAAPASVAASAPPAADVAAVPVAPRMAAKAADARMSMRAAVPAPMMDSVAPRVDTARVAAARRKFQKVQQLEAVTMTGAVTSLTQRAELEGCYTLHDSANAPRGIPLRFALQRDPGSAASVVRTVTADGRLDSVVAGSSWRVDAPGRVTVSFATPSEPQPLTLHFMTTGAAAQATVGGRLVNVSVQRLDCRP